MVHSSDFWPPCCRWNLVSNFPTTRGIRLAPRGPCREHQECSALHREFMDRAETTWRNQMPWKLQIHKSTNEFLTVES